MNPEYKPRARVQLLDYVFAGFAVAMLFLMVYLSVTRGAKWFILPPMLALGFFVWALWNRSYSAGQTDMFLFDQYSLALKDQGLANIRDVLELKNQEIGRLKELLSATGFEYSPRH